MRVKALAVVSLAAAAALVAGCKSRPDYDRSSPEATLKSFFLALDKERLPEDLETFVLEHRELASWRLRCKSRGCSGGAYEVVSRGERSEHRAVLYADYEVTGEGGGRVMRGRRSPIHFQREGEVWYITRFGRQLAPEAEAPENTPKDGGPPGNEDPAGDAS